MVDDAERTRLLNVRLLDDRAGDSRRPLRLTGKRRYDAAPSTALPLFMDISIDRVPQGDGVELVVRGRLDAE